MALHEIPADAADSDDWFGEGNAFETLEDLAAAVAALAGPAAQPVAGVAPAEPPGAPVRSLRSRLHLHRPRHRAAASEPDAKPVTWSVRAPGSVSLPRRQPGRSGWPLDGAVELLQQTDAVMARLREQAVTAAFRSAARALRPQR